MRAVSFLCFLLYLALVIGSGCIYFLSSVCLFSAFYFLISLPKWRINVWNNLAFKRPLKLFIGIKTSRTVVDSEFQIGGADAAETRENFALCILLSWIATPQDSRERPSEDGVAWNLLTECAIRRIWSANRPTSHDKRYVFTRRIGLLLIWFYSAEMRTCGFDGQERRDIVTWFSRTVSWRWLLTSHSRTFSHFLISSVYFFLLFSLVFSFIRRWFRAVYIYPWVLNVACSCETLGDVSSIVKKLKSFSSHNGP